MCLVEPQSCSLSLHQNPHQHPNTTCAWPLRNLLAKTPAVSNITQTRELSPRELFPTSKSPIFFYDVTPRYLTIEPYFVSLARLTVPHAVLIVVLRDPVERYRSELSMEACRGNRVSLPKSQKPSKAQLYQEYLKGYTQRPKLNVTSRANLTE